MAAVTARANPELAAARDREAAAAHQRSALMALAEPFVLRSMGEDAQRAGSVFVALLAPVPAGHADGNISFDGMGNPVSVNNAFLDVCGCAEAANGPCTAASGKMFDCALGDTDLLGTGFGFDTSTELNHGDHGSTGWLETRAPAEPDQEITVRWAVYDSNDGLLDTTTLIDGWRWLASPGIAVITTPIPQ